MQYLYNLYIRYRWLALGCLLSGFKVFNYPHIFVHFQQGWTESDQYAPDPPPFFLKVFTVSGKILSGFMLNFDLLTNGWLLQTNLLSPRRWRRGYPHRGSSSLDKRCQNSSSESQCHYHVLVWAGCFLWPWSFLLLLQRAQKSLAHTEPGVPLMSMWGDVRNKMSSKSLTCSQSNLWSTSRDTLRQSALSQR